jgi:hypothetical protein
MRENLLNHLRLLDEREEQRIERSQTPKGRAIAGHAVVDGGSFINPVWPD